MDSQKVYVVILKSLEVEETFHELYALSHWTESKEEQD